MTTELKDAIGNEFSLRTKDVSVPQNNSLRQNWHLYTKYPIDHTNGGAFYTTAKSNTMTAGLAANAPIASFRFASPATMICVLRKLELSMWSIGTLAVGLASFDAFIARTYTSEDTGGLLSSLSGNNGKLRTKHQSPVAHLRVSDTAALTLGTRTLDAAPFENIIASIPAATANIVYLNNAKLFEDVDHPLILENNEGLIIQASVPATGTWGFNLTAIWDEVEAGNY